MDLVPVWILKECRDWIGGNEKLPPYLKETDQVHFRDLQYCLWHNKLPQRFYQTNNRKEKDRKLSKFAYLRDILSGNIDLTTRTLTFSPTFSTSSTELMRVRVMFDICSNPLHKKGFNKCIRDQHKLYKTHTTSQTFCEQVWIPGIWTRTMCFETKITYQFLWIWKNNNNLHMYFTNVSQININCSFHILHKYAKLTYKELLLEYYGVLSIILKELQEGSTTQKLTGNLFETAEQH